MDVVTLAAAKKYADGQRIAYEEIVRRHGNLPEEVGFPPNEDLGGLHARLYLGTFNCEETDVGVLVIWDGVEYYTETEGVSGAFLCGNHSLMGEGDDTGEPFLAAVDFTQNRTLIISKDEKSHVFGFANFARFVHTIDPKFLPCLTSPSGKQFKLTVDDNGTVTATEV